MSPLLMSIFKWHETIYPAGKALLKSIFCWDTNNVCRGCFRGSNRAAFAPQLSQFWATSAPVSVGILSKSLKLGVRKGNGGGGSSRNWRISNILACGWIYSIALLLKPLNFLIHLLPELFCSARIKGIWRFSQPHLKRKHILINE